MNVILIINKVQWIFYGGEYAGLIISTVIPLKRTDTIVLCI